MTDEKYLETKGKNKWNKNVKIRKKIK